MNTRSETWWTHWRAMSLWVGAARGTVDDGAPGGVRGAGATARRKPAGVVPPRWDRPNDRRQMAAVLRGRRAGGLAGSLAGGRTAVRRGPLRPSSRPCWRCARGTPPAAAASCACCWPARASSRCRQPRQPGAPAQAAAAGRTGTRPRRRRARRQRCAQRHGHRVARRCRRRANHMGRTFGTTAAAGNRGDSRLPNNWRWRRCVSRQATDGGSHRLTAARHCGFDSATGDWRVCRRSLRANMTSGKRSDTRNRRAAASASNLVLGFGSRHDLAGNARLRITAGHRPGPRR